jgi:hypothetical protein
LEKARREVSEHERFRDLVWQMTEVNEAICEARPVSPPGIAGSDGTHPPGEERGAEARLRPTGETSGR